MEKRNSMSSIHETQGIVPDSPTHVYLDRLAGWTGILKKLLNYFEFIISSLKSQIEFKTKISDNLYLKESNFQKDETFQILYSNLIQDSIKESMENSQFLNFIESQILPILNSLIGEVKKKATDHDKEWTEIDREINSDRDTYIRLVSNLRTALVKIQWKDTPLPDKDFQKDPWMANQLIKKHALVCEKKQTKYREALLEQSKNFFAFETIILQNLKVALSLYFEFKAKSISQSLESTKELKTLLSQIDVHADWQKFQSFNGKVFSQIQGPLISVKDLTYDGFDDPLTKIIQKGTFLKKDVGMFKTSWKSFNAVLTGSGFFHLFTLENNESELPVLSLDLSECTVGPLMLNEKEPEEFTISEKSTGIFGREVKHKVILVFFIKKFKGKDMEISAKWWSLLSDHIRTIKKSIASHQQLMHESQLSADPKKPIVDLQQPLQPSITNQNVSRSIPNTIKTSIDSPNQRNSDSQSKPNIPLPPRRVVPGLPVSKQQETSNSNTNSMGFRSENSNTQSNVTPPVELDTSNLTMNPSQTAVPLAIQMEMALNAAVEERKSSAISNPWGEDEDNVWG